ncbi:MAG: DinB family protein [Bacteroidetes bacterium]|nr:MAG: DinB family protein [Bacteroidota bacterium]UCE69899.1 MAG: DinB family protein [Flavobacteriaceae bacterium]
MNESFVFQTLLKQRKHLARILTETSPEHLQRIPDGFNNNIWWNAAHTLVVQQLLCYRLSGLPMHIDNDLAAAYSKGTFPGTLPEARIREKICDLLTSTVGQLRRDFEEGIFKEYTSYTTSAGVTLENIEDAILFNLYHEGLHMGTILALLKAER